MFATLLKWLSWFFLFGAPASWFAGFICAWKAINRRKPGVPLTRRLGERIGVVGSSKREFTDEALPWRYWGIVLFWVGAACLPMAFACAVCHHAIISTPRISKPPAALEIPFDK